MLTAEQLLEEARNAAERWGLAIRQEAGPGARHFAFQPPLTDEKVARAIDSFMWIAARDWPAGTKLTITQLRVVESTIVFNLEPDAPATLTSEPAR
jgi:hypothetical protein